MKHFILLAMFCLTNSVYALQLNGNVFDDGHGSLFMRLETPEGREYAGNAEDEGDGTLKVTVQDEEDDIYYGYAGDNGNGKYNLKLRNQITETRASGIVSPD